MPTSLRHTGESPNQTFTTTNTSIFIGCEFNSLHVTCECLAPAPPEREHPALAEALHRLGGLNASAEDRAFNEEAFRFIFCMLLPPPGIPQFQHLRQPTIFLLAELCKVTNSTLSDNFRTRLTHAAELLFDLLYDFPSHEPPWQRLYPLYYFHLKSWSVTGETMRPSYRRYGLACHLQLCSILWRAVNSPSWRLRPRHPDKQSREYDIAVAMVAFIRFCPVELSNLGDPPLRRPSTDLLLSTFIRALYAPLDELTAF